MSNEIVITPRVVFGRTLYYPVNDVAKALARIANADTLSQPILKIASGTLGMKVTVKHDEDEFLSAMQTAREVC